MDDEFPVSDAAPLRVFIGTVQPLEQLGLEAEFDRYGILLHGRPEDAEFRRRALAGKDFRYSGSGGELPDVSHPLDVAESYLGSACGPDPRAAAIRNLRRDLAGSDTVLDFYALDDPFRTFLEKTIESGGWKPLFDERQRAVRAESLCLIERGEGKVNHEGKGAVYAVEVSVPPERFVSFDLPLRLQPEFLAGISAQFPADGNGWAGDLFETLEKRYGNLRPPEWLRERMVHPDQTTLQRAVVETLGFSGLSRRSVGQDRLNVYVSKPSRGYRWKVVNEEDGKTLFRAKDADEAVLWSQRAGRHDLTVYDLSVVRLAARNGIRIDMGVRANQDASPYLVSREESSGEVLSCSP